MHETGKQKPKRNGVASCSGTETYTSTDPNKKYIKNEQKNKKRISIFLVYLNTDLRK